jgi:mannan endo-1,4-beta-mannosidase
MMFSVPFLLATLGFCFLASASHSFAGSSLYFLPGLSASDQAYYIDTLGSYGAKVIRIWVRQQSIGCEKGSYIANNIPDFETTLGHYNWETLETLDSVLAKMVVKGMKAIISVHDGNLIHDGSKDSGCDIYCQTYGNSFYSNIQAKAYFDARVAAILQFTSPSSGKRWGEWSDAILAFDIENEPFQFTSDGANNDPSGWLCGRAATFKKYIINSNIKVATGGIGGDWVSWLLSSFSDGMMLILQVEQRTQHASSSTGM